MRSNGRKILFPLLGVLAHILEKSPILKFEELPANDKWPDLKVFNIDSPSKGWAFLSLLPSLTPTSATKFFWSYFLVVSTSHPSTWYIDTYQYTESCHPTFHCPHSPHRFTAVSQLTLLPPVPAPHSPSPTMLLESHSQNSSLILQFFNSLKSSSCFLRTKVKLHNTIEKVLMALPLPTCPRLFPATTLSSFPFSSPTEPYMELLPLSGTFLGDLYTSSQVRYRPQAQKAALILTLPSTPFPV